MRFLILLLIALLAASQVASNQAQSMHADHLRCEYLENPIGIGETKPRLSWWCESPNRGEQQTAYQVLFATSPELLQKDSPDLWDSGQVQSDESTQIEYAGKPLSSREKAWWKVRIWDSQGQPSDYSPAANWEIGLLTPSDWQA